MNRISMTLSTIAVAIVSISVASAQPLSVSASGAKRVTLSDRVGKNQITWTSDAPLEKIQGTANASGQLTVDPKKPTSLAGTITVPVASMQSGNTTRDEHLRGAMWLDAAKYPNITFKVVSVASAKAKGNSFSANVTGDFTMHGVTKRITVPFTLQYIDETAKTRQRAPGDLVMVTADFTIALKDFNVAGREGTIGSKVGESIKLSAKLFGSTAL